MSRASGIAIAALVGIAAGGSLLVAQQPLFRAAVEHVAVDVVVTDSHDRPVTDLTKADFQIIEHDKAQTIDDFKFIDVPVEHREIVGPSAPAPPPDVESNTPPSPNSRLFVFVIDDLHIPASNIVPVKHVMNDFIQKLPPNDELALTFVSRSDLSVTVTRDVSRILTAIDNVHAAFGFGKGLGCPYPGEIDDDRSSLDVLRFVSQAAARSSFIRRAIVFVSDGFLIDQDAPAVDERPTPSQRSTLSMCSARRPEYIDAITLREEYQRVFDDARRADMPVYALDPRGLTDVDSATDGWPPRGELRKEFVRRLQIQHDHLATIAINTGGRAFFNRSDLDGAVSEIVGENGSFYLLGYSPTPLVRDGKFHEISVRVSRPGVHVRARQGYVAPGANATAATTTDALNAALGAGVNTSGLALRAFAAPIAVSAKGMTTAITLDVTYPTPPDGPKTIDDELKIGVVALDPDGKIKSSVERTLHFKAAANGQPTASFLIDDAIDLPTQPLTLRVALASQALGTAGSVQLEVTVPKPADDDLQLGALVIGTTTPREPAMNAATMQTLVPFQPTTERTFAASDSLRVFARAFWGAKVASAPATITLRRGTTVALTKTLTLDGQVLNGAHRQATLDTTLPLAGLTAGAYTLEVTVTLPNTQSATKIIPFEVR